MDDLWPGWHIVKNPKPIPDRQFDYDFWHDDYDGADGGNGLSGTAPSIDDAMQQIMDIQWEHWYTFTKMGGLNG